MIKAVISFLMLSVGLVQAQLNISNPFYIRLSESQLLWLPMPGHHRQGLE